MRLSDAKKVMLKKVVRNLPEVTIAQSLTTPERLQDPRNHCVPILDQFRDDSDMATAFIVMPLLREFWDPSFVFVSEVIDFVKQTLEASNTSFT